jgi:hypothetical protein
LQAGPFLAASGLRLLILATTPFASTDMRSRQCSLSGSPPSAAAVTRFLLLPSSHSPLPSPSPHGMHGRLRRPHGVRV